MTAAPRGDQWPPDSHRDNATTLTPRSAWDTSYTPPEKGEVRAPGKDNVLLFPTISQDTVRAVPLQCRERLGGLLKDDECEAA